MEINEKNIKMWSVIGTRATFGISILDIVKTKKNLMVLTADVSTSAGLDRFKNSYPENYIDVGIAEQNMIGIATGLSSEGFNVITTTFSPFQTLRCLEQIKVNLGYMKHKVSMVGLASGLVLGSLGFTHCSIEDIGVLRSIPNINIVCPSDSLETIKATEAILKTNNSTYLRLTGSANNQIVNKKDYKFEIGKSIKLREGKDIVIFSHGAILGECLKAAEDLENKNVSCRIVNMHTIKPLDTEAVKEAMKFKLIFTIEEHNVIGGLGSAVSEYLSKEKLKPKQITLGVNDYYEKGGSYKFLIDRYGLSKEKIIQSVISNLS